MAVLLGQGGRKLAWASRMSLEGLWPLRATQGPEGPSRLTFVNLGQSYLNLEFLQKLTFLQERQKLSEEQLQSLFFKYVSII